MNLRRLIPLYLGAAMGPMGGFGIVTILPVMAQAWSVAFSTAAVSITVYMIPFIVIQIFSGSIAQLFDVRRTLMFGFTLYAVGAVLSGLAPNLTLFLLFRVLQGIGAGFLTPVIMALIGEIVPPQHVGKAIGLLGVAYTIGITFGPFLSGVIEVRLGWPWFFYFMALLAVVTAIAYWFTSTPAAKPDRPTASIKEILPMLVKAVQAPDVLLISFAAFSLFLAYIGVMTFTADHLKTTLSLPSDKIGTILSITGLSGIIVSPIAGLLGDRLGRRGVFLGGAAIAVVAIALMATIPYTFYNHLLFFLILGTGAATAWTSLNTLAIQIAPAMRQPVTSIYNAIKFSGYALAPAVLSLIYKRFTLTAVHAACIVAVMMAAILTLKTRSPSTWQSAMAAAPLSKGTQPSNPSTKEENPR
ncbi:MAG: MFS transporter [Desulfatitalea sp.]|nr:MFS transporter [Desulfatitalea sp.]